MLLHPLRIFFHCDEARGTVDLAGRKRNNRAAVPCPQFQDLLRPSCTDRFVKRDNICITCYRMVLSPAHFVQKGNKLRMLPQLY